MMNWKGFRRKRSWSNLKGLSQHSLGGTEEIHKNPQSGYPVSEPRYEPGTSRKRAGAPMVVNLGLLENLDRGLEHR
jgi:hypothetical protein